MRTAAILLILLCNLAMAAPSEIRVAMLLAVGQRSPFEQTLTRFTQETGISVKSVPFRDADYKRALPQWLLEGTDTPDIVFWQASQRLYFYASKNGVRALTTLWREENLDKDFAHVKSGVTYKGEIYGLPIAYYSWGIWYNKPLIDRYGGVPANWEDFIALCQRLHNAGVTPIGLGAKDYWPAAAWFDYIDLRLNGLAFHQQLLGGELPFTDPRVQRVFIEWKRLIDAKFFNTDSAKIAWDEVFPFMYRGQIGMSLVGSFATTKLPGTMTNTIGLMSFPKMANLEDYEEAPMDVILIPQHAPHIAEAETFLRFMARAEVQSTLAADLGFLPANKASTVKPGPYVKVGADLLRNAAGVSQYFDRDTSPTFEKLATPLLADFILSGDIKQTTNKLEQARKAAFGR